MAMTRRTFLLTLLGAFPSIAYAFGPTSRFRLTRLETPGGNWNPRPSAAQRILWEVSRRTSVDADLSSPSIRLDDPRLFYHPFLYLAGDRGFAPFSEAACERLERFLSFGGFLLIDDCSGSRDSEFDRCVRRELGRIFPYTKLAILPKDHTLFQTYYLIDRVSGRVIVQPVLEGITLDEFTPVIYSRNDLAGAWARDPFGNWRYEVVPGGERQRELAIRLGINVVLYALTTDYKEDLVHLPAILKRRR